MVSIIEVAIAITICKKVNFVDGKWIFSDFENTKYISFKADKHCICCFRRCKSFASSSFKV